MEKNTPTMNDKKYGRHIVQYPPEVSAVLVVMHAKSCVRWSTREKRDLCSGAFF